MARVFHNPAHSGLSAADISDNVPPLEAAQLHLGFAGDVYLQEDYRSDKFSIDFDAVRECLWRPFSGCPLIVTNLEAPITRNLVAYERKAYNHKSPETVLDAIDKRCFLSIANNHIMDYGQQGLTDTVDALTRRDIPFAGAGLNIDEAKRPCIVSVGSMKVGIVCAADPRFHAATTSTPGTCPALGDILEDSVVSLRNTVDVIIVALHMGLEHVSIPSRQQLILAEVCLASGAHIVQYHHAHRICGVVSNGHGVALLGTGNYAFMKKAGLLRPWAHRTAAWRVILDTRSGRVVNTVCVPARLDEHGIPTPLSMVEAKAEACRVRASSSQSIGEATRVLARARDCLHPGFLLINFYNYFSLLKKRGFRYVARQLIGGIRAQFGA